MKKILYFLLSILGLIMFCSCNNELTLEEAKDKVEDLFDDNLKCDIYLETNASGTTSSNKLFTLAKTDDFLVLDFGLVESLGHNLYFCYLEEGENSIFLGDQIGFGSSLDGYRTFIMGDDDIESDTLGDMYDYNFTDNVLTFKYRITNSMIGDVVFDVSAIFTNEEVTELQVSGDLNIPNLDFSNGVIIQNIERNYVLDNTYKNLLLYYETVNNALFFMELENLLMSINF